MFSFFQPPATYLLSSSGVVCGTCFVERPFLVGIIINPLTKVIPNVKAPEGRKQTSVCGQLGCMDEGPAVCWSRTLQDQTPQEALLPPLPVVIATVLKVNQHEAVVIFWL